MPENQKSGIFQLTDCGGTTVIVLPYSRTREFDEPSASVNPDQNESKDIGISSHRRVFSTSTVDVVTYRGASCSVISRGAYDSSYCTI